MPFVIGIIIVIVIILALTEKRGHGSSKQARYRPKLSKENLGNIGESQVSLIIGRSIAGQKHVFNDYVVVVNGQTSQIDHIVVNKYGVFVIETKNYSGRIYGSEEQQEWTQVLAGGNEKNRFYNPLKQNATHIYNLRKIIKNVPIHSVVVFAQNNTQFLETDKVICIKDLSRVLCSGVPSLNPTQIDDIGKKLMENNQRGLISNIEHINNIREKQEKIEKNICPRCGAPLVLRKGKYGEFWGCSKFPKCKFIKK